MATKGDQIRNLVKTLGGAPRNSTIEDAIEDLVNLFTEKREVEMVEIVPLTEVEITEKGYDYYAGYIYGITIPSPAENEIFEVIFDGKKYTLTSSVWIGDEYDLLWIGNGHIISSDSEDTGEPFYIENGFGSSVIRVCRLEPGTHTISISQKKETVTPPVVKLGGARYDLDVKDAYFVEDNNIYFINPELCRAIRSGNIPVVDCWDRSQRNATAWFHYNINTVLVYDKSLVEFCGTTDSEDYSNCSFKVFPSITEFEEYMD